MQQPSWQPGRTDNNNRSKHVRICLSAAVSVCTTFLHAELNSGMDCRAVILAILSSFQAVSHTYARVMAYYVAVRIIHMHMLSRAEDMLDGITGSTSQVRRLTIWQNHVLCIALAGVSNLSVIKHSCCNLKGYQLLHFTCCHTTQNCLPTPDTTPASGARGCCRAASAAGWTPRERGAPPCLLPY